ncbi:MAG: hypothetical protein KDB14_14230 [Planctomycetales bacterium]|nr:hypothetical protein [Planctomycetales bacterium]
MKPPRPQVPLFIALLAFGFSGPLIAMLLLLGSTPELAFALFVAVPMYGTIGLIVYIWREGLTRHRQSAALQKELDHLCRRSPVEKSGIASISRCRKSTRHFRLVDMLPTAVFALLVVAIVAAILAVPAWLANS